MIDNKFYYREAEHWWSSKDSPLMLIRYMMNPLRLEYVLKHLDEDFLTFEGLQVKRSDCALNT